MITMTSADAQNHFGELIDRSQREPVEVTRRGRVIAYVLSKQDAQELVSVRERRKDATRWYARYRDGLSTRPGEPGCGEELTDATVNKLVHELR
jgi:prevent-host-death family protein